MNIKIIKFVLKIENIFCVYRNYYMFTRKNRILTNIRTLLELSLITACIMLCVFICHNQSRTKLATFLLSIANAFIILLSARWYARSFKKLIAYINANHSEFSSDTDYTSILEKKYKIFKGVLVYYGFLGCSFIIFQPMFYSMQLNIYCTIYYIYLLFCNIRYIFEYVVMYSILTILTEHVRCIDRGINEKVKILERINHQNLAELMPNIEFNCYKKWTVAYTNIKECSNLFNRIFGVQMTVVLVTAMLHFIIFLYRAAYFTIAETNGNPGTFIFYCVMFLLYIIALLMLSRSAYALQISGDCLRRQLAKLLIHCPINHISYRATKDLLGLVATHSLRTRAFGSLPIDMTLLPSSVMFFTTYTVIALQFNNVV